MGQFKQFLQEKIVKSGEESGYGYLDIKGSKASGRVIWSLKTLAKNYVEVDVSGSGKRTPEKLTNLKNVNRQLNDIFGKFDISNKDYINFLQLLPCTN